MLKFVLIERENNEAELRMANVDCHFELVFKGNKCLGGGAFFINDDTKKVILYGKSYDYGRPQFAGKKITCDEFLLEDYEFHYVDDLRSGVLSEKTKIKVEFD